MNINPIETVYKGHRFRSRLEARWAVFFDVLGIEWEYEIEGFKITANWSDKGTKTWYYLPDFYLPESKTWVEVKGLIEDVSDDYWFMLACVVDWGGYLPHLEDSLDTERGMIILSGLPSPDTLPLFPILQHGKGGWCRAVEIYNHGFRLYPLGIERHFDSSWGEEAGKHIKDYCMRIKKIEFDNNHSLVKNALVHARSARFEYGEKPIIKQKTNEDEYDDEYFMSDEFNEECDRVMAREERHERMLEEKLKEFDWVKRPDGISDNLFYEIMDEACSWKWWVGDVNEKIKDGWWSKIIELNRDNKAFHGENSFL